MVTSNLLAKYGISKAQWAKAISTPNSIAAIIVTLNSMVQALPSSNQRYYNVFVLQHALHKVGAFTIVGACKALGVTQHVFAGAMYTALQAAGYGQQGINAVRWYTHLPFKACATLMQGQQAGTALPTKLTAGAKVNFAATPGNIKLGKAALAKYLAGANANANIVQAVAGIVLPLAKILATPVSTTPKK